MKKVIPILLMTMLFLVGVACAATTVTLDSRGLLANNSYKTSASVQPNFKVVGNISTYTCKLYSNTNGTYGVGSWHEIQTDSGSTNNTNITFDTLTLAEVSGLVYTWDVFCNGTDDANGDWGADGNFTDPTAGGNMNFSVDITAPAITSNEPTPVDVSWDTNGYVYWNFTVVDNNVDSCKLYTLLNASTNTTGNWALKGTKSYTNNTWFNFTFGQTTNLWADNNTGVYKWYVQCNDSATQVTTIGNYTFYVDTVAPAVFDFNTSLFKTNNRYLWNATTATDYTPQVGYNSTTELNFSRYLVCYYNNSYADTSPDCVNVTTITTLYTSGATIEGDKDYLILITAYDVAGNARNISTLNYKYSTDSTNRALKSGWNIIGNVGNSFNLSDLLIWSSATTVSVWQANHTFASYVSGGTDGGTSVAAGYPVLLYLSADANFSDLIWNATAVNVDSASGGNANLTNQTSSDWNLMMELDDDDTKMISDLDKYINCNPKGNGCSAQANNVTWFDYMSFYNNTASSGSKYIPYVANWSINNATTFSYGECLWVYLGSGNTTHNNIHINWSVV